jgi:hypothetical protein
VKVDRRASPALRLLGLFAITRPRRQPRCVFGLLCLCLHTSVLCAAPAARGASPGWAAAVQTPSAPGSLQPFPAAGAGQSAPSAPVAPAGAADPSAPLRARLEAELARVGTPRTETSPALALEQVLDLLERDAVLTAALQARAYLGLQDPTPPAAVDASTSAGPAAHPEAPAATDLSAQPAPASTAAPATQAAAAAPLQLSETERALFEYLRGLAAARASERLAAEEAGQGLAAQTLPVPSAAAAENPVPVTPALLLRREAEAAFDQTILAAGPGDLRQRALYNLGTLRLLAAERAFLAQASAQLLAGAGSGAMPAPELRAALEGIAGELRQARTPLLEHLRLDWRARDLRSNLEWIQRRLEEIQRALDQLPPPEEQPQEQESQDGEPEEPPPQEDQQNQQDQQEQPDQQDQQGDQQKPGEGQDQSDQPEPSESDPESNQESEEPQPEEGEGQGEPQPGEAEQDSEQEQPGPDSSVEAEQLTPVEIQRLLDRLARYEAARDELLARQRSASRTPVERDW